MTPEKPRGSVEIEIDEFLLYCDNIVRNPDNPPGVIEYATALKEWIKEDFGRYIQRFYISADGGMIYARHPKGKLGFTRKNDPS